MSNLLISELGLEDNRRQFQEYWVKKVYSGAAHEPLSLMPTGMQIDAVRSQKVATLMPGPLSSLLHLIPRKNQQLSKGHPTTNIG
jgi:hypothetical protein